MQKSKKIELALDKAYEAGLKEINKGFVADYIPELAKQDRDKLAVLIKDKALTTYAKGDIEQKFTLQSISKVFALMLALETFSKKEIFSKVGMEASSAAFSELSTLGELKRPSNPFINAGAIVISSMLSKHMDFSKVLEFMRKLSTNEDLDINETIYLSESKSNYKNRVLTKELANLNLLSNDIEESLDFYTLLCSIEVSLEDLANLGLVLVNKGKAIDSDEQLVSPETVRICLSLMYTCGLYNDSGRFATIAGIPAKSGVSGGILAIKPYEYSIASFSPALDHAGNSIAGVKVLSSLSKDLDWHTFS